MGKDRTLSEQAMIIVYLIVAAVLLSVGAVSGEPGLDLEKEQSALSYSVGYQVGTDFVRQETDIDPEALLRGVEDALSGHEPRMSRHEMRTALTELQKTIAKAQSKKMAEEAERSLAAMAAFLDDNGKKEGVVTLPSGLQYEIIVTGNGTRPVLSDKVIVHYIGTLLDGTVFDSSYRRKEPSIFALKSVIEGWREALQRMPEGSKWKLFVPPHLAYGDKRTGMIPPNSALIFEVELIEVIKNG